MFDRVTDVVRLALECFKRQQQQQQQQTGGQEEGTEGEKDEGDLAKRLAEIGMADTVASSVVGLGKQGENKEATDADLAALLKASAIVGEEEEEEEEEELLSIPHSPVVSGAVDPAAVLAPSGVAEDKATKGTEGEEGGVGVAKARSSLRSGIQAFLSESQGASGSRKSSNDEPLLDFS
jgi:hypothetical protein